MLVLTKCPNCLKQAQVDETHAGRQVRCPHCNKSFTISLQEPTGENRGNREENSSLLALLPPVNKKNPRCPACKTLLPAGATVCLDCGWVRIDVVPDAGSKLQPVLCVNTACGAANPPNERYCQRCNTLLPAAAGSVLHGRYRIERLIAMGGFGAVYQATDVKANCQVAIKDMICADPQEFEIRLNFFRREADILRAIESLPAVPRLYDFIQQGQSAHIVMEYLRGETLLKLMESNANRPFPFEQVVNWGMSICDVLNYLHRQKPPIVHRDIKPDNLMLLGDGKTMKMIDFGTARDVGRNFRSRVRAKTRVFTEGYAPPEQIVGKPEPRSDLFALASTLYHLATGKDPEGSRTAQELEQGLRSTNGKPVMARSPQDMARSPDRAITESERWFYELIKINLSEDANDRYHSAAALKADLTRRRVTREVRCPACEEVNIAREPYCRKCGQSLTEPTPPCNHCGRTNHMGSRFCVYCGNRMR